MSEARQTGARADNGLSAGSRSRLQSIVPLMLLVALWLATRPYFGVVHDARLYTLQALNSLYPGRFGGDLYFKYGSQDSFTAFTPIYKFLVASAGPALASLLATAAGEAIWLTSLICLMRTLFEKRTEWLFAAAAVIVLHPGYGGVGIFAYGEPFGTPRLFAEGLVLGALAFGLRRRFVISALLLAVAAAVHPLVSLCGIGVLVLVAASHDHRVWFLIGLGAIFGLLLCAARFGPFDRAWLRYDNAWFQIVLKRCDFGFISQWHWWDLCQLGAVCLLLAAAYFLGTVRERPIIVAMLLVTLAGLLVSFVGADLAHNILIVNLQLWRVLWLATVFANAYTAIIFLRLPSGWVSRTLLLISACAGAAAPPFFNSGFWAPFLIMIACVSLAIELYRNTPLPAALRVLAHASFGIVAGVALLFGYLGIKLLHVSYPELLGFGSKISAISLLVLCFRSQHTIKLAVVSAVVLVAGAASVAQVASWQKYVFSSVSLDGLRSFVSGAGNIYWEGDHGAELLWFKLGVPSYYSCLQGTGSMFYRDTANDYNRRGRALRLLNTRDFARDGDYYCETKAAADVEGPTSREQLATACRSLPDLDTMILNRPVPGVATRAWRAPTFEKYFENDGRTTKISTFYRYSCAELRR